mgnify:CR=1 FL=1
MLKIVEFIKSNKDWENILTKKPYSLKISRDNGFIMFKYDQINSDFKLDIVKEARGLILKDYSFEVVCYPFTKFFNVDEIYADDIDWNSAVVQEKIDGSLIKLWCDTTDFPNTWYVSTNGVIDAFKCEIQNSLSKYNTFGELFMSVFDNTLLTELNKNYTYMFELVSPYNKVVVDYPITDIYHIGTRDNISGNELNCDIGIQKPKIFDLSTEEEVKNAAKELPFNEEGYVVVDKYYHRVKIKSPAYVNAHRLINNHNVNKEKVLELILENEQEEFLSYFPEYRNDFKRIKSQYNKLRSELCKSEKIIRKIMKKSADRKDFALSLYERVPEYMNMGFCIYDNKITNYEDYLSKMKSKDIIERMEKYE